ncbi:ribose-phosphate pyrophosphokinase [Lacrimispora saccharolytica]|uniref:ribose-phosphate pyrophosphokinase n=1 Tax=Lacrimispora saccharolytica TaxID=84030 RepID=UPI001B445BFE|nr:ribose-phosphate pyrophosphokinase [Lacrimispora saccharolytica]MBP9000861.1 ribose-phosphate pyrophosphokinase [Lachnospiraceae bacterium]MBS7329326.1 ribose-phosphate pyrophosphokinase [Lachnospiraceae bacterium]MCF2656309.1 ribose-phosphate pyrophosphokinase [Lacrimispora saccharolytica]MDD7547474.1 ribose-phosphate pyrophosphokinase [Lachnospiraceae bacterium]
MDNFDEIRDKLPVAPLEIIAMDSAKDLARGVDSYIVQSRKAEISKFAFDPSIQGYQRDTYLGHARCPRFGTGEAKAVLDDSIRGKDLFLITDVTNSSITYRMNNCVNHMSPDDHYQDLKRMIAAAAGKAKRVNVIMPFLYEGRQHRRSSRESLDCAFMLEELYNMGVDNFITFDAHDPRVANAIPLNGFDNYTPPTPFINALFDHEKDMIIDKEHLVVISPDEGALNRSIYFANVLGVNTGMFYKRRDYTRIVNGKNPIVAHEFLGDNIDGKDVIVMDDMISSGESMIDTARQLKEMNARRVYICCTFGLFTNGLKAFDNAYERCYFEKLVTTNLNYRPSELLERPYYVEADMTKFLADIINMMNHDASMSNVHHNSDKIHQAIDEYNSRAFLELDEHA